MKHFTVPLLILALLCATLAWFAHDSPDQQLASSAVSGKR